LASLPIARVLADLARIDDAVRQAVLVELQRERDFQTPRALQHDDPRIQFRDAPGQTRNPLRIVRVAEYPRDGHTATSSRALLTSTPTCTSPDFNSLPIVPPGLNGKGTPPALGAYLATFVLTALTAIGTGSSVGGIRALAGGHPRGDTRSPTGSKHQGAHGLPHGVPFLVITPISRHKGEAPPSAGRE
jgi:hypothetical protein